MGNSRAQVQRAGGVVTEPPEVENVQELCEHFVAEEWRARTNATPGKIVLASSARGLAAVESLDCFDGTDVLRS